MKQVTLLKLPDVRKYANAVRFVPLFLMTLLLSTGLLAQGTVRGKVTDESGNGMPGVNVVVKTTSIGTTTDSNGEYVISPPPDGTTLIFSFIGYTTREIAIGGRSVIDVELSPSVAELGEIVVTGYGTQRKSDVTGSLVRVTEEALSEVPVANITQALQGRAAGIDINPTSSRPGGGAQIRIRGSRSFSASNDPLIVLDGIPFTGTINDINPSDIVAIDILKDASATAIYGSRGSNGVILISTRRGKVGKPQLTYDGYYGVTSVIGKYDLYNGKEFDAFRNEAVAAGASYAPTADEIANLAAGKETDWQDEVYKNGFITNHQIGVSGGTEETQYSISAGYFKQTTVLPGQAFTRYSLNAVLDQKIGERIKIGLNTMNSLNITDGENVNPMFQLLTLSPLYNAYNPDGSIYELPATGSIDAPTRNPLLLYRKDGWKQQRNRLRTFNSLYGEVSILDGLKYRLNVGLDFFHDTYGQYIGSNTPFANGGVNSAQVQNTDVWSYTLENLLMYEKSIAEKHNIRLTGLFSVQEAESSNTLMNTQDIPADYVQYYNPGLANVLASASGTYQRSGLLSYMFRANYGFKNRYLFTLTGRADGSSRLAPGNQWLFYPAAALGWIVSNESFMEDLSQVSTLKLRVGYGQTGNQSTAPYSTLGALTRTPYNYGSTGLYGYFVSQLPNPDLGWEHTTTTNIGVDLGLAGNRITASFDYYIQKTEAIIQNVSLPATSGVSNVAKNIGKTDNKGIEVTLTTVNLESRTDGGLSWITDLNFFLNRGKITELSGGVLQDIGNGWFVGQPIDAIFDYEKIGIWQTGETDAPPGFTTGEIKLKDQNDDGVINADDRVILGSTQPKWSGGLTNRFAYKGFDLSFVLFWRVGGTMISTLYQANISFPINSLEGRRNGPKVDYWTPTNPTNAYPRPGLGQVPDFGSTIGYFDATFMKVRSINFGYSLPKSFLGNTGINSARIYFQAQNPFKAFFSDYVKEGGVDPETTGLGGSVTPGWGNRPVVQPNTPPTKAFIFGINLKY